MKSQQVSSTFSDYGLTTVDDLYAALGYGKITSAQVLEKFFPSETQPVKKRKKPSLATKAMRLVLSRTKSNIKVNSMDDQMVYRAECCNPVPGESIIGYITRGKGVSVHTVDCTNLLNLMIDPDRRIDVSWQDEKETKYNINLSVKVEDRKGILAEIAAIIADKNTDIRTVESKTFEDQTAFIDVTVSISNIKELNRITKSIRTIEGVLEVTRQELTPQKDRSTNL